MTSMLFDLALLAIMFRLFDEFDSETSFDRELRSLIMLDNLSELGRPIALDVFATRGGPSTRDGFTPCPPTGRRGIVCQSSFNLGDRTMFFCFWFGFCLLSLAVAADLLFVTLDMWGVDEGHSEKLYNG